MATQTKGLCKYCGKEYAKGGMQRHLRSCMVRLEVLQEGKGTGGYFGLVIEGKYELGYWLIIEMPDTALLDDLDQFLRDIWCECCGHLSAFTIDDRSYERYPQPDYGWGPPAKSSRIALKKVLREEMTFSYEYDFGSTTELKIKVLWHRTGKRSKDKVTILSRNNAYHEMCGCCGAKEATQFYLDNWYEGEDPYFCDDCCNKENIDEGMLYPVCNSPRMGVCGYCGSEIYPDQFVPDPPRALKINKQEKQKLVKKTVMKKEAKAGGEKSSLYIEPKLSPEDSALFYGLWFPLLDYVNEKARVNPKIGVMTGAPSLQAEEVKKVANYMWEHTDMIDDYLQEHPKMEEDHQQILRSWKRCRTGRFVLERHLKKGSILICAEDERVYRSVGIVSSWEEMFPFQKPPILFETTLIPFRDVIISDGLTMVYPTIFGGNMKSMFKRVYMEAKNAGEIITAL